MLATALLRQRIVEDFTHDKGLKLEQIGHVLAGVIAKLRSSFSTAAKAVREALRPRRHRVVTGLDADLPRTRAELAMENILLRQASRKVNRPVCQPRERGLIALLAAVLPSGATRCYA